ncbi:hypothetical protein ACSBR1_013875 [Camellia fascicularis]
MRCSPVREIRGDNHRRGRSLEGGILLREKNDDLALFNEMETKERDSLLLPLNDDFEDTFIDTPVRAILRGRGIDVQAVCPRCVASDEMLEHVCFQCPFSKHIWQASSVLILMMSVGEWIKFWFKQAPDEDAIIESVKILWGIWLHRNKAVHEQIVDSPSQLIIWNMVGYQAQFDNSSTTKSGWPKSSKCNRYLETW